MKKKIWVQTRPNLILATVIMVACLGFLVMSKLVEETRGRDNLNYSQFMNAVEGEK